MNAASTSIIGLTSLVLLGAPRAGAQQDTAATGAWTSQTFSSRTLNEKRTIYVATPDGYKGGTARYPVLLLLDADDQPQFNAAVANVRFLASRNAIPALIVVGIANGKDRTRDMTPAATGETAKQFGTAGGARKLAEFVLDEVLPSIRAHYRTLPSTVLAGHSFGGLFALHVAATRPNELAGIVAMSPSLWWNDTTAAAGYADSVAHTTATLRLFATSGGLEGVIDRPAQRFEHRLDSLKPPTLAFGYRRYPESTHDLTPLPSLVDGLRFVFEPVAVTNMALSKLQPGFDSATAVNAAEESIASYARGARSLGLPDVLPESQLNQWGYYILTGQKKPALAVWFFRRNVELYPESANVYDSLGDGLLAAGDTTGAKAQFRRAVDVAAKTNHGVLAESRRKLDALEKAAVQAGKPRPK